MSYVRSTRVSSSPRVEGDIELAGDILPDSDNQRSLGSSTKEWKDVRVDNVAYLDSIEDVAREIWIPATVGSHMQAFIGDHTGWVTVNGEKTGVEFLVPYDYTALVEAVLAVIPSATGTADWDIYSDYAGSGESYSTHSESDTASTYGVTQNDIFEVDVSGILSSIAAGDYVGVVILDSDASIDISALLGLRFKYN